MIRRAEPHIHSKLEEMIRGDLDPEVVNAIIMGAQGVRAGRAVKTRGTRGDPQRVVLRRVEQTRPLDGEETDEISPTGVGAVAAFAGSHLLGIKTVHKRPKM